MRSTATLTPREHRTRWYTDRDGALATSKRRDEVIRVELDLRDRLESGETLTGSTYQASGNLTVPAWTGNLNNAFRVGGLGEMTITTTTSLSRTLQTVLRFVEAG